MSEFHVKKITLPSGKVVELVYLHPPAEPEVRPAPTPAELRQIERCPECESGRVHPVDWHEVDERSWRLDLRCPDCRWQAADVFMEAEVERYDDVLNAETDMMIDELDRITRENMADHLERFIRALEDDGIMPIDF